MSSTEISPTPEYLRRVRQIYPGAVSIGRLRGFEHQVRAQVRLMEKRGEIVAQRRYERLNRRSGILEIPYVRMIEVSAVRRAQRRRIGIMSLSGAVFLAGVAWLAWESRFIIMTAVPIMLVASLLFYLVPHWGAKCSGIHCSGCKG